MQYNVQAICSIRLPDNICGRLGWTTSMVLVMVLAHFLMFTKVGCSCFVVKSVVCVCINLAVL